MTINDIKITTLQLMFANYADDLREQNVDEIGRNSQPLLPLKIRTNHIEKCYLVRTVTRQPIGTAVGISVGALATYHQAIVSTILL